MSDEPPRSLDLEALADLANLPLTEEEGGSLRRDCRDVLEAFQLPSLDEAPSEKEAHVTFPDEPDPWTEEGVAKILDQAPSVEGRTLKE